MDCLRRYGTKFPSLGLVLETIATVIYVAVGFLLKVTAKTIPWEWTMLGIYISLTTFPLIVLSTSVKKTDFQIGVCTEKLSIFVRVVSGISAYFTFIMALNYIPLADLVTIVQSAPILVCLLARPILGEIITAKHLLVALVTIVGVTLVSRPSFIFQSDTSEEGRIWGIMWGLLSCVSHALIAITNRKIQKTPATLITSIIGFSALPFLVAFCAVNKSWSDIGCFNSFIVPVMAILNTSQAFIRFLAYRLDSAGRLSLLDTSSVPMTFAAQVLFLKDHPPCSCYFGAGIIMACLVTLFASNPNSDKKATSLRTITGTAVETDV